MLQQAGFSPLARVLIVAAAACVVAAFMRWAAPILAPILLAFFITIIAIPPLQWMRRKGLPKYLAVLIILLVLGTDQVALPAGSVRASADARRYEFRDDTVTRGVTRLKLKRRADGAWQLSLRVAGIRAPQLLTQYPRCEPLAAESLQAIAERVRGLGLAAEVFV